jgi:hypothetical protein
MVKQLLIAALLSGGATAFAQDATADGEPPTNAELVAWCLQYMIATATTAHEFGPIATVLTRSADAHVPEVLDVLAEAILVGPVDGKVDDSLRARQVRALHTVGGARYRGVVSRVAGEAGESQARREARDAIGGEQPADVAPYVPGTVNLTALREGFIHAALAASPSDEQALKLSTFPRGRRIEELVALVGKPQAVVSGGRFSLSGSAQNPSMAFYYRGLGRVVWQYRHGVGWMSNGVIVDPLAYEEHMPYRVRADRLGMPDDSALSLMQLLSPFGAAIRASVDGREDRARASRQFMDIAAEVLFRDHAKSDDAMFIDAMAYICVMLRREGGLRYRDVLKQVSAASANPKLQKFAGGSITADNSHKAGPYVPGSVSLDDLRARQPALYPQRTFTSGVP